MHNQPERDNYDVLSTLSSTVSRGTVSARAMLPQINGKPNFSVILTLSAAYLPDACLVQCSFLHLGDTTVSFSRPGAMANAYLTYPMHAC